VVEFVAIVGIAWEVTILLLTTTNVLDELHVLQYILMSLIHFLQSESSFYK
jgi:hypothetical protein